MKPKQALIFIQLILFIGCSEYRVKVHDLDSKLDNFEDSGDPITVLGIKFSGVLYQENSQGRILELRVKNGVPVIRGFYKNGLKDGLYTEYYKDGRTIKVRRGYKNGVEHGIWESYFENGKPRVRSNYIDGESFGLYESFHLNGALEFQYYKKGDFNIDGLYKYFYDNSQLGAIGNYKDGKRVGRWESYDRYGNLELDSFLTGYFENDIKVSFLHKRDTKTQVVDVYNTTTGKTWMDRNLGASRAATSPTDVEAYGDLYQWGREADGHQKRSSPQTFTKSSTIMPNHDSFIKAVTNWHSVNNDNLWQGINGINNPCPMGYRIPTEEEWDAERQSWISNDTSGAFASPLKLTMAGEREVFPSHQPWETSLSVGFIGYYWSSNVSGQNARRLSFNQNGTGMYSMERTIGYSVRCIKD